VQRRNADVANVALFRIQLNALSSMTASAKAVEIVPKSPIVFQFNQSIPSMVGKEKYTNHPAIKTILALTDFVQVL
jgi:hypothetical protein